MSASEILKLADRIIAKSKEVHDAVASVPLDKVFIVSVSSIFPSMLFLTIFTFIRIRNSYIFITFLKNGQVTYKNVISPLAELEAQQFPLVQSCVVPKLVSTSDKVRKASAEAEKKIDAHISSCRFSSLVYDLYQNQVITLYV